MHGTTIKKKSKLMLKTISTLILLTTG